MTRHRRPKATTRRPAPSSPNLVPNHTHPSNVELTLAPVNSAPTSTVTFREGEPIPGVIKAVVGAFEVVSHTFAGKALVVRYDLPAKYHVAYRGKRRKCLPSDKEDRAISYNPPNEITGRRISIRKWRADGRRNMTITTEY